MLRQGTVYTETQTPSGETKANDNSNIKKKNQGRQQFIKASHKISNPSYIQKIKINK